MGKLVVITGGAKSGKSVFAESLSPHDQVVCYVATGVMRQPDAEMQLRIQHHQQRRPAIWVTAEQFKGVPELITQHLYPHYLLDDATMLTTNLFYDLLSAQSTPDADFDQVLNQMTKEALDELTTTILTEWRQIVAAASQQSTSLIVVTNEVGLGVVPMTKQTRVLRDIYGEVNQLLAQQANDVYFVISGLPQKIK